MNRTQTDRIPCYDDAVRWIYERIDYERIPPVRVSPHFQLERVRRQLELIGSPQQRIPAVHIAGTKGKGSTASMVDSVLRASGLRTGLFTSPHIELFEERMRVDGRQPGPAQLMELVAELQDCLESADEDLIRDPPTYFEVATLLAWMYFDRQQADIVVLETGLGGRLDCTNVCSPLVTVITSISLDHTAILGDTIEQIAREKAGIIKPGIPVVLGVRSPAAVNVCESTAERNQAPTSRLDETIHVEHQSCGRQEQKFSVQTSTGRYEDLLLPLAGAHQADNAALAVAAVEILSQREARITPESIRRGLRCTSWPLRFEVISDSPTSPTAILDAAHNPDSVAALIRTLNSGDWPEKPRALIFGACRDKDIHEMLSLLLPEFEHAIFARSSRSPRGCTPAELQAAAAECRHSTSTTPADNVLEAVKLSQHVAGAHGLVVVTGSLFLAAEVRSCLGSSTAECSLPSQSEAG